MNYPYKASELFSVIFRYFIIIPLKYLQFSLYEH